MNPFINNKSRNKINTEYELQANAYNTTVDTSEYVAIAQNQICMIASTPIEHEKKFCVPRPVFSYKLRYIVGFWLVEMAISTIAVGTHGNTKESQ